MIYEWDEAKRRRNRETHGIDFAAADGFEWDNALTERDTRRDYGEHRFVSIGFLGPRLHVLVWTERGGHRRLVSLRRANPREIRRYADRH